jgi:hypothetical protein
MESRTSDMQEQAIIEKTCKKAVKDAMHAAKFSTWREDHQVEMSANTAVAEDDTLSRETYIKAYTAAQSALMPKPVPFSLTGPTGSQILQAMLFEEEHGEYGFDGAYMYIRARVESAVGLPQESETMP